MLCALEEASAWPAADGRPRYDAGEVDAVCFVPATAAAFARRGFDHMELVARELCRLTGLPLADVLVRRRARDQRELGQAERAANLAGTVEVADDVSGMRLLLLDDVMSELDERRREAVTRFARRGVQTVITTTNLGYFSPELLDGAEVVGYGD